MRRDAMQSNAVTINTVVGYHYSNFESIKVFNSDRYRKVSNFDELNKIGLKEKLFGQEFEMEFGDDTSNPNIKAEVLQKVVFSHFPNDFFRIERDGSLRNGCECITQTATKSAIRNNYKNYKSMYDEYFPAFGISSKSARCGLHTNISLANFGKTKKEQDLNIRKMHYLINYNFEFWCRMFNRRPDSTGYCARMNFDNILTPNFIDELARENNHYVCINYGHYNDGRIELRLVGGQKDFRQYRDTMETIFFMLDRIKSASWQDLESNEKFFKGCNQYVFDGLKRVNAFGLITNDEIERIYRSLKLVEW